jgi:E3 ubiquitin-protein ligase DOA10
MQCRYCLESSGPLINPCSCKTPVHAKCLQKWIKASDRNSCEICLETWDIIEPGMDVHIYFTGAVLLALVGVLFFYAALSIIEASFIFYLLKIALLYVLMSSMASVLTIMACFVGILLSIGGIGTLLYYSVINIIMETLY